MKVIRNKADKTLSVTVDELDLDAEQSQTAGGRTPNNAPPPQEQGTGGFGLTLQDLTPAMSRRLQLPSGQTGAVITDVDPDSGSAAAGLQPGDVIMSVNRVRVSTASDTARELMKIPSGRLAQILLWRDNKQVFATVKKD
jgi:serine protease Do